MLTFHQTILLVFSKDTFITGKRSTFLSDIIKLNPITLTVVFGITAIGNLLLLSYCIINDALFFKWLDRYSVFSINFLSGSICVSSCKSMVRNAIYVQIRSAYIVFTTLIRSNTWLDASLSAEGRVHSAMRRTSVPITWHHTRYSDMRPIGQTLPSAQYLCKCSNFNIKRSDGRHFNFERHIIISLHEKCKRLGDLSDTFIEHDLTA